MQTVFYHNRTIFSALSVRRQRLLNIFICGQKGCENFMTDYLISTSDATEHYFYRPYEGICMRRQTASGIWQEHSVIMKNGRDSFCVYADDSCKTHLICINSDNELVYSVCRNNARKTYTLSKLSDDILVTEMRLYSIRGRLNLLYSALYNGENLLIHCILGDHAKPSAVDSMESSHFFIKDDKVYYTNTSGSFGYIALSDEKPSEFVTLYNDAHQGYIANNSEFTVFVRESKLFLNGKELLYDSRIESPIIVNGNDRLYIMWKSGSFIRYVASFNGGITWSEPMRFMSTGEKISRYFAQQTDCYIPFYGFSSEKDIVLLGKPKIFSDNADYEITSQSEFEKLRLALDSAQKDIMNAKQDIQRLNRTVNKLKSLYPN